MKKTFLLVLLTLSCIYLPARNGRQIYMWLDCEANYERLSSADSVEFYIKKIKDAGFTAVVADMKSIMGEVLYKSQIAPYMGYWKGVYRSEDYDMLSVIMESCRKHGLGCLASMNVFSGGHNFFERGIIYKQHPQWQSQVWWKGKLMPISQMKWNYNGMLNPADPEVREYELSILKEFVKRYPNIDGLILDRVRYDDITSDYGELSKKMFEKHIGNTLDNFPEEVLEGGKYYKDWLFWRAMIIKSFVSQTREELKKINPELNLGFYTGSWYPYYYMVGVNWASEKYNPSKDYKWASEEYSQSGFAELMDIYMTGLYYTKVYKSELAADKKLTEWDCVEGAAENAEKIIIGAVPITGSIYVEQYKGDDKQFSKALKQALKSCKGGIMLFDLSHICSRNWWNELSLAIK